MIELSVIIPTRNRADCLGRALDSILSQSLDASLFEIIVVDNGSSDCTRHKAEQLMKQSSIEVRYVHEESPGLHNGRHRGADEARGSILVYCDDDIRASRTWLEAVRQAFSDPSVALVGGKNLPEYEAPPPEWVVGLWDETVWGKALGYYSLLDFGDEICEIPPEYVWGCNFSIRKKVLETVGGFHPDAMPDHLLRYRGDGETAVSTAVRGLGLTALYHPQASVHHFVPKSRMTFEYLYKRCFAQGVSDSFTLIRRCGGVISLAEGVLVFRRMKTALAAVLKEGPIEMCEARKVVRNGYRDGVAFHLEEVKKDEQLLQWVLKHDFRGLA